MWNQVSRKMAKAVEKEKKLLKWTSFPQGKGCGKKC
jgi:hypothetical protein